MSNTEWISLHNAAIRVIGDENTQTDEEWDILGWPSFDSNHNDLKRFALACHEGKILTRGLLTKGIFKNVNQFFYPEDNREIIVNRILKCTWTPSNLENQAGPKLPCITKYVSENETDKINGKNWQKIGPIWTMNYLVDFEFDLESSQAKKLDAKTNSLPPLYNLLDELNIQEAENPYQLMYFKNVEIELNSLNKWLKPISITPKSTGRPRHKDWDSFELFLEDYLKFLDEEATEKGHDYSFRSLSEFVAAYMSYMDIRLKEISCKIIALKQRAIEKGIQGTISKGPHESATRIEKYIRDEIRYIFPTNEDYHGYLTQK